MQDLYLQDTTHFIKVIESANRVPGNALLVSMDDQPLHEYPTGRRPYFSMQARNKEEFLDKNPIAIHSFSLICKENKISSNTRNGNGHGNGSSYCQYFFIWQKMTDYLEAKYKRCCQAFEEREH